MSGRWTELTAHSRSTLATACTPPTTGSASGSRLRTASRRRTRSTSSRRGSLRWRDFPGRPRVAERTESEITREILRACNLLPGVTLWRVNSRVLRMPGEKGRSRLVRFGGMKGMSDLIGWRMITVTMIARDQSSWPGRYAVWVALEVKRPGQDATAEQQAFLDAGRVAGGLAAVVHSAAEAVEALR